MMQCRMCSQRLTRPGRLCRECERELDRARLAAASADGIGVSMASVDMVAETATNSGASGRLGHRMPIVAAAFALGVAGALTIYAVQQSMTTPAAAASVMLDRDVSGLRPRSFVPVVADRRALAPAVDATAAADAAPPSRGGVARTRDPARPRATGTAVATRADAVPAGASAPVKVAAVAPARFDRVLALSDAFTRCAQETFFARVACEQRARARYCDGVEQEIPQCAGPPPRDYGQ